ncbi:unnamed protein product [Protopolystoma xenopodis]|uniref:Uncharacterized protein n=1 Tax=Protopolystoma xenopodis TaxID=117903 RepID=A0A3S5CIR1_9PLAT|nr:unnamed protein product [Protopolystoma xenopodis]
MDKRGVMINLARSACAQEEFFYNGGNARYLGFSLGQTNFLPSHVLPGQESCCLYPAGSSVQADHQRLLVVTLRGECPCNDT